MKIGFNPLRDMLLTITALSLLLYVLARAKGGQPERVPAAFLLFDRSDLKGVVDSLAIRNHLEVLKLNNSSTEYLFAPDISRDGAFFHACTEKGDSIIKPSHSLVITVKGKEKTYTYTFKTYKEAGR